MDTHLTDDETQADVIVINTCCFIHDAKEESINTILEMAQYKEQNLKALVVAGCLAERYKDEILKEIPEIDAVLGTTSYDSIVEAVNTALEENTGEHFEHYESIDYLPDNSEVERVVTTGNHMAYFKKLLKVVTSDAVIVSFQRSADVSEVFQCKNC